MTDPDPRLGFVGVNDAGHVVEGAGMSWDIAMGLLYHYTDEQKAIVGKSIATTAVGLAEAILKWIPTPQAYQIPVGGHIHLAVGTNPAELLGYGTWELVAAGRVLVGYDPSDSDFDTIGAQGGTKNHNHGIEAHTHDMPHVHPMPHNHTAPSHVHPMPHTHDGPDHNHGMPHTHTHAHAHSLNEHTHTHTHEHELPLGFSGTFLHLKSMPTGGTTSTRIAYWTGVTTTGGGPTYTQINTGPGGSNASSTPTPSDTYEGGTNDTSGPSTANTGNAGDSATSGPSVADTDAGGAGPTGSPSNANTGAADPAETEEGGQENTDEASNYPKYLVVAIWERKT